MQLDGILTCGNSSVFVEFVGRRNFGGISAVYLLISGSPVGFERHPRFLIGNDGIIYCPNFAIPN